MNNHSHVPQPAVSWSCHHAVARMQAVADMLLLIDDLRPVCSSNPSGFALPDTYSKCKEEVIRRTQKLQSFSARISEKLHAAGVSWTEIATNVKKLSSLVVALIEGCVQLTYLKVIVQNDCVAAQSGIIDPYAVSFPHYDIELSCQRLKRTVPGDLGPNILVETCVDINRSLVLLTECCAHASDNAPDDNSAEQFKLCVKCFTASASCLLSSVKRFKAEPSDIHHRRCITFSKTLVAATAATVNFATEPTYVGRATVLSSNEQEEKKNVFGRI